MTKKGKLLLLIPALWASVFDVAITTVHQSKEYWSGDLSKANEANPIGNLFMGNHVAGLFIISFFWLVLIGVLGYWLPRRIAKIFLLFCVIAHSFGASTWLTTRYGFWYIMALILFNAVLYCTIEYRVEKKEMDGSAAPRGA